MRKRGDLMYVDPLFKKKFKILSAEKGIPMYEFSSQLAQADDPFAEFVQETRKRTSKKYDIPFKF